MQKVGFGNNEPKIMQVNLGGVDKYGMTRLAGTNILDIGGGKGELNFELLHLVNFKVRLLLTLAL